MPAPAIRNELLAALPPRAYHALLPALAPVTLALGKVLHQPGAAITQVYFPCESMVSLLSPIEHHADVEVGLVGREGMVGASLGLGIGHSPVKALVQGAGSALRMSAPRFRRELARNPALRRGLNAYLYVMMAQIARTAGCNRYHRVEARLARWLLMTRDRMHSAELHMTHEFLSVMLGVRRVGITEAAGALQSRKLIEYRRGKIRILDDRGLEAAACSCYAATASPGASRRRA